MKCAISSLKLLQVYASASTSAAAEVRSDTGGWVKPPGKSFDGMDATDVLFQRFIQN
jgi:hypothetical protein